MDQNEEQREMLRRKGLTESGLAYTVAAVLSALLAYLTAAVASAVYGADAAGENGYLYFAYLSAQLAFCGALAVYFVRSKEPLAAPFRRTRPKYFLLAVLLAFGLLFSLSELNGLFISSLEKTGYQSGGVSVPDLSGWNLLPAILVIGVLPALFEETLFRGILARKMYESGWGQLPAVLLSGALFALFHGRPEQTVYQFLCGACYALLALRAGSALPTILAHFLNNLLILVLSACGYADLFAVLPLWGYLLLVIGSCVCFAGVILYLVFFDRRERGERGLKGGLSFFIAAGGGILICAAEWIAVLVMGFVHG